jgi:WD and tetratricopeptide repeat-containing protein 1
VTHTILQKLYITENLISRLGLEKELAGHSGCVNCLEWNESGQYVFYIFIKFYFMAYVN